MRTIIIQISADNHFDVIEGANFCDSLMWDEMLGTIAVLTHPTLNTLHPRIPPYRLRSFEEVRETERDLRRRVRELESQMSPEPDGIPV